ncbi:DUF2461 domain-containing protein [Oleiagrimonas soli]|uniref:Uncharacterized protein (TIGR02453 family) n=1 Tax=Oleiagrimonas soli TaxID=1543381 RepID=A0A099CWL8_9GAMM|nr:DUF2461 domain-containing protein [Oleiagrimonas soli]KGI78144.1 hypothetical protein LF63_0107315 [Oleiagrimonas soli]MBB6183405.1 uncharacterized protein (TIGR02453 family) [Oleiagrimonas soli]
MSRSYFSDATFRFLTQLKRNNSREWFHAHKDSYEAHLREPFLALIADLQEPIAAISPHYRADPSKIGGSLFRIHRDVRFSNNKLPYKTWSGARFFHERRREVHSPSFYLHIEPGNSFAGGGIWHPESPTLRRIRHFIADNPDAWKRATRSAAFRKEFAFHGERLTRPPRGFDPEHELIEDLKLKSFATGAPLDDALVCSPRLTGEVVRIFKRVAPLVDYLCASVDLEF